MLQHGVGLHRPGITSVVKSNKVGNCDAAIQDAPSHENIEGRPQSKFCALVEQRHHSMVGVYRLPNNISSVKSFNKHFKGLLGRKDTALIGLNGRAEISEGPIEERPQLSRAIGGGFS